MMFYNDPDRQGRKQSTAGQLRGRCG